MRDKREMTFEELLDELKRMKHQMRNFSAIQKENNRLDAEYYHNEDAKERCTRSYRNSRCRLRAS